MRVGKAQAHTRHDPDKLTDSYQVGRNDTLLLLLHRCLGQVHHVAVDEAVDVGLVLAGVQGDVAVIAFNKQQVFKMLVFPS